MRRSTKQPRLAAAESFKPELQPPEKHDRRSPLLTYCFSLGKFLVLESAAGKLSVYRRALNPLLADTSIKLGYTSFVELRRRSVNGEVNAVDLTTDLRRQRTVVHRK